MISLHHYFTPCWHLVGIPILLMAQQCYKDVTFGAVLVDMGLAMKQNIKRSSPHLVLAYMSPTLKLSLVITWFATWPVALVFSLVPRRTWGPKGMSHADSFPGLAPAEKKRRSVLPWRLL